MNIIIVGDNISKKKDTKIIIIGDVISKKKKDTNIKIGYGRKIILKFKDFKIIQNMEPVNILKKNKNLFGRL